jgi:CRP/FNR family transcriptional regulator
MIDQHEIISKLSRFGKEAISSILESSQLVEVPKGTEILRQGQYIKSIPLIINGLVKVFTRQEDKELLLYYIQSFESCVMSFSAGLKNEKSKVFAITEENSSIILIPAQKISQWINEYPTLNELFYSQYNLRYLDLLQTINHLLFDKLDTRLLSYLKEKVSLTGKNPLVISHREIANELGTAREVVSRIIKKFEKENRVLQLKDSIQIL